jgi:hypothetical protein
MSSEDSRPLVGLCGPVVSTTQANSAPTKVIKGQSSRLKVAACTAVAATGSSTAGLWVYNAARSKILFVFVLAFQVSFVPKAGQQPTTSLKPTPPLIAPLPPDLFYPFLTSAAGVPVRAGVMRAQQWLVMGVLVWIAHVAAAWL